MATIEDRLQLFRRLLDDGVHGSRVEVLVTGRPDFAFEVAYWGCDDAIHGRAAGPTIQAALDLAMLEAYQKMKDVAEVMRAVQAASKTFERLPGWKA